MYCETVKLSSSAAMLLSSAPLPFCLSSRSRLMYRDGHHSCFPSLDVVSVSRPSSFSFSSSCSSGGAEVSSGLLSSESISCLRLDSRFFLGSHISAPEKSRSHKMEGQVLICESVQQSTSLSGRSYSTTMSYYTSREASLL